MPKSKLLICVVGPTGIGKTSLGISLASALDTEVISADSRQFYKEMNIGTAVPSAEELNTVNHHFIQHKSIFDAYSVGDYEKDALELLEELFETKDVIILVGGSGLYVDAVVRGLDDFPKVDDGIRTELQKELETYGIEQLQKELKTVDPESYSTIDLNNKHRLIRALEIYRGTGKPFSSFKGKKAVDRHFDAIYIGLTADRDIVYKRIEQRVDLMFANGLEAEARKLYEHRHLNALQTVGYKELFDHFEGNISLEEAIAEIKKNTRRFAKRQGTWYRKNEDVIWFDYETDPEEIIAKLPTKKGR